jgi:microcystin-dependent protein
MSVPLVINGVTFNYPVQGDGNWGPVLTSWSTAVTNALVPITGGVLTLSPYPNTGVNFANSTNSGFLSLTVNGANQLTFNGTPIGTPATLTNSHIFVGNVSNQPTDVPLSGDATMANTGAMTIANNAITSVKLASNAVTDIKVAAGAAIAVNKLAALTPSTAVATDSSGFLVSSSTTATELGYVHGVTSAIQTQINGITGFQSGDMKAAAYNAVPAGWLLCDGTSYATATYPALFSAIGYVYGGVGANFNVPNMVNAVPIGAGSTAAMGITAGSNTQTLTQSQLPVSLGTASSTVTDPGHFHTVRNSTNSGGTANTFGAPLGNGVHSSTFDVNTLSNTTGITVATTITNPSGGSAVSIVQPSLGVTWFIKI